MAAVITRSFAQAATSSSAAAGGSHQQRACELLVSSVIRPEDIGADNTIDHSKIAEAHIFYGGRGDITRSAQPLRRAHLREVAPFWGANPTALSMRARSAAPPSRDAAPDCPACRRAASFTAGPSRPRGAHAAVSPSITQKPRSRAIGEPARIQPVRSHMPPAEIGCAGIGDQRTSPETGSR